MTSIPATDKTRSAIRGATNNANSKPCLFCCSLFVRQTLILVTRVSFQVASSQYRFGEAGAVRKTIQEYRVKGGSTREDKLAKLANQLATGGLQTAKTERRRIGSCASGTLTELMSTVHTATSAAAQGRRINALSSRHDSSDLTSGIFTGVSIY